MAAETSSSFSRCIDAGAFEAAGLVSAALAANDSARIAVERQHAMYFKVILLVWCTALGRRRAPEYLVRHSEGAAVSICGPERRIGPRSHRAALRVEVAS